MADQIFSLGLIKRDAYICNTQSVASPPVRSGIQIVRAIVFSLDKKIPTSGVEDLPVGTG